MEVLEHFSHEHPLTFCEEAKDHGDEEVVCSGCTLPVLGHAAYSCTKCKFFLHKSCAESPSKITCIFHRHHPLTLYEKNPYGLCDICDKQVLGFTYCCERCEVNFHLKCASEHRFEPKGHQHSFMLERPTGIIFTCDVCDIESLNRVSFLCTTCQLRVHKNCTTSYPLTVKQVDHAHQVRLTYSTEFKEFKGRLCRICYQRFNNQLCCYTCASCFYIAHLDCATSEDIRDEACVMEDEENLAYNAARALMPVDPNQVTDLGLISQDVIELSLKESPTIVPVLITHFSHKHCLRLINEELKSEQVCDGCTQPIISSIPFYSCVDDCHFFLHKSCTELPNKIQHTLHRHPLTLLTKVPWHDFVMFVCDICQRVSNGFTYACEICKFSIDVLCSSFLDTLGHKSHPAHVLNLIPICYDQRNCNACDSSSRAQFVCEECKFNLDLGCASLPYQINHDCPKNNWHTRPLYLIYNFVEDDSGESEEYYCDVCEERREKNAWFYYCADCDDSVHPWCTAAKYMIKFGKSYKLPHHSHPLTLVENTIGNTPCATCGDPCKHLILVCSECNFNIHSIEECYRLH